MHMPMLSSSKTMQNRTITLVLFYLLFSTIFLHQPNLSYDLQALFFLFKHVLSNIGHKYCICDTLFLPSFLKPMLQL